MHIQCVISFILLLVVITFIVIIIFLIICMFIALIAGVNVLPPSLSFVLSSELGAAFLFQLF